MAHKGPPDLSKPNQKGPPDLSKKVPDLSSAPGADATTPAVAPRIEKHEDGSTSIDVTEAVVAGKKLFSTIGQKAKEAASKGELAAAALKEKTREATTRREQEKQARKESKPARVDAPAREGKRLPLGLIAGVCLALIAFGALAWFLMSQRDDAAPQPEVLPVEQSASEPRQSAPDPVELPAAEPSIEPTIEPELAEYEIYGSDDVPAPTIERAVPIIRAPAPSLPAPAPAQAIEKAPEPVVSRPPAQTTVRPSPRPAPVAEKPRPAPTPAKNSDKDLEEMDDAIDDFFKKRGD